MRRRTLAALLLCAGCTELQPIEIGICGNAVIETGEDCDGPAPDGASCGAPGDARSCRFVCLDGAACPAGSACGRDGVCRSGAGAFQEAPGSPLRLRGELLPLSDFDGDGALDLAALARQEVSVRMSAAGGRFGPEQRLPLASSGPAAVRDLDRDGRADLIVPTAAGLVVLAGQADRTLAPRTLSPFDFRDERNGRFFSLLVDPTVGIDGLGIVNDGGVLLYGGEGVTLPGRPAAAELAGVVAVADVGGNEREEAALGFVGASEVHVLELVLEGEVVRLRVRDTIAISEGARVFYGVRFADLDGDGDADLLVSVGEAVGQDRVVASLNEPGGFTDAVFVDVFDRPALGACRGLPAPPSRRSRWPLAAGDLGGPPAADFVMAEDLLLNLDSVCSLGGAQPAAWTEAVIADFNRDGNADVAAVTSGQPGVDFLLGGGGLLRIPARVDTTWPPHGLTTGDFDGDGVTDLAVIERDAGAGDTISVLYGQLQGPPLAPAETARLPWSDQLVRLRGVNLDEIDDLLVSGRPSADGSGARATSVLLGTAERLMISPFVLRPDDETSLRPFAVVAGRLGPGGAEELIALAPERVVDFPGAEIELDNVRYLPLPAEARELGSGSAVWGVGPVDGEGGDRVVALVQDADGAGARLGTAHLEGTPEDPRVAVTVQQTALLAPRLLELADLDADGRAEALVSTASRRIAQGAEPATEPAAAWILWNAGGALDPAATPIPVPPGATAVWAALPLQADRDPALELAVLCDRGIWLAELGPDRTFELAAQPALALEVPVPAQLRAGDLDLDGVDDLVVSNGDELRVLLARPRSAGP